MKQNISRARWWAQPTLLVLAFVTTISAAEKPFGIEKRVPWTTSRVTGSPTPPSPYVTERVFPKLEFKSPVTMVNAPGTDRLFVMELGGKVFSFPNNPNVEQADLFIDLAADIPAMKQAYGLTFHPQFEQNRYCYICYVLAPNIPNGTRVSRFKVSKTNPPKCDAASETVIIDWLSGGHNGGCLKFGPDGCLYISTGDGSGPNPPDTLSTGQDLSDLLSSILRIDVDHPEPGKNYRVPADNPFISTPGARPEIWAYGFRNPWKMSFDRVKGELWTGDVGWELWELVYRVERGANYGWSVVEGRQPVKLESPAGPTPISPPTADHLHTEARSVTGGYVYHGKRLLELVGAYIYGDYVTGKIWGLWHDGKQVTKLQELTDTAIQIIDFGEDNAGEIYFMDYGPGTIHRLVPRPPSSANQEFPRKLSDTGLYASVREHFPACGVYSYSINAEAFADFTVSTRWVALPDTTTIQYDKATKLWKYPKDAVLLKTISLDLERGNPATRRRLETQVLHFNGEDWVGYTYLWNDDQTDATLADAAGADRTYTITDAAAPGGKRQIAWHFSSRTECAACHNPRAGSALAFNPAQLDRDYNYAGTVDNQWRTLTHIGLFSLDDAPKLPTAMADPYDSSANVNQRARAYLHTNCAHCHRRGGGGTAPFELQHELTLEKTFIVGVRPSQGTFDIHGAQVVAPGDPARSILFYRMAKLGRGHMPHSGATQIDEGGLDLMHAWISSLSKSATDDAADATAAKLRAQEKKAVASLAAGDSGATATDRAKVIENLLAAPNGALALLRAVDDKSLSASVRDEVLAMATIHANPQVRDLFERFLPDDKRIKRLGTAVKPEAILSLRGDAARGKQLFAQSTGMQCRNCHKLEGVGNALGPDLAGIAKKQSRGQVLESLLEPSKTIDAKFVTYLVETKEGKVFTGLLTIKTATEVVLTDAQNKPVHLLTQEIELLVPQRQSLMPDLLVRDLTAQEVADLLEYVMGLQPSN